MDRNCTAQSNIEESSGQNNVILIISIGSVIIVFTISGIILILYYKRKNTHMEKRKLNFMHDDFIYHEYNI